MILRAKRSRAGAIAAACAALAIALTGCSSGDTLPSRVPGNNEVPQGQQPGTDPNGAWQEFPAGNRATPKEFTGTTETGATTGSADLAGKVSIVNFWYAACPPCRVEARDLEAVKQQFAPQGVEFLGVNIYDQAPTVDSFNQEFGVTYPSILDVSDANVRLAFADSVPPQAIPTTLVLDREGRVAAVIRGPIDKSILKSMLETVLAEGGK